MASIRELASLHVGSMMKVLQPTPVIHRLWPAACVLRCVSLLWLGNNVILWRIPTVALRGQTHYNLRQQQAKEENIFINLTTQHHTLRTTQHITETCCNSRNELQIKKSTAITENDKRNVQYVQYVHQIRSPQYGTIHCLERRKNVNAKCCKLLANRGLLVSAVYSV